MPGLGTQRRAIPLVAPAGCLRPRTLAIGRYTRPSQSLDQSYRPVKLNSGRKGMGRAKPDRPWDIS